MTVVKILIGQARQAIRLEVAEAMPPQEVKASNFLS